MNQTEQQILRTLQELHADNRHIAQKIDDLKKDFTKKATTAGAIAGAVAGGTVGGVVAVGVEIFKAKWGL